MKRLSASCEVSPRCHSGKLAGLIPPDVIPENPQGLSGIHVPAPLGGKMISWWGSGAKERVDIKPLRE